MARKKKPEATPKAKEATPKKKLPPMRPGEKLPPVVTKSNVVLENLVVELVLIESIKPNGYNPNQQTEHDFTLLCKSIDDDGFTQPVIVQRSTREIVDGEHRWRACKKLGFKEIPIVLVDMSPEQMRIATLRHNRARGSESEVLAGDVIRQLAELGALDWAKDGLQLDPVELETLLKDVGEVEAHLLSDAHVKPEMLGPSGKGLSATDKKGSVDLSADKLRAKEKLLSNAKEQEEKGFATKDQGIYRLMLFFTEEQSVVKDVLDKGEGQAANILRLCREYQAQQNQTAGEEISQTT